jgi:serine/threonine protein kinase
MAEPQADPTKQPEGTPPPASGGGESPVADLLLNVHFEPSDDAPTIISKTPGVPRADDAFTVTLRGRHLAHFELIEPIGVGGMAAVIRARDTQLDRTVALKILPPEMAVDPENVRRFHQEARAAAKLDHENIARVFYCGEDQGLHFIAFEFVEGDNLRTIVDRRGRIPVPEAVHYMLQVATGLDHAWARGVVHRDIKPSNVIVSPTGRAKLVDMGLARSLEPQSDHGLTHSGVTLGTFDYISPEQALEPREADVRSDIYSLGCTFYHMLTGRPPVPEGTAAKKLHHHQHVAPIDPRQINPDIPDEVAAVLGRMMAKDPKDRYQRPENLVHHLMQLATKLGAIGGMPDGVLFVDGPLPSPPRSRPVLVAAAAALALVALVVLHGMFPGQGSRPVVARDTSDKNDYSPAGDVKPPMVKDPVRPSGASEDAPKPPPAVEHKLVKTAKELADFLEAFRNQAATSAEVSLENDLDLTPHEERMAGFGNPPGLVFEGAGRELTIEPKDPRRRVTIKLSYNADAGNGATDWTALRILGGKTTLRRLRFEVDARQAPRRAQLVIAAVKLQEAGRLTLEDCEFIQINPLSQGNMASDDTGLLSSVVVKGWDSAPPRLALHACYFAALGNTGSPAGVYPVSGQDALSLSGGANVEATDCAFAPHAALFHFRKGIGQAIAVTLLSSSAFLVDGTAFQLDDDVATTLRVSDCVFSHPLDNSAGSGGRESSVSANLIFQTSDGSSLRYLGNDNCYHNLNAFWVKASLPDVTPVTVAGDWEKFRQMVSDRSGGDDKSRTLTASPWAEKDPLKLLRNDPPHSAFKLKTELRDLRQAADPERLVGVKSFPWKDETYGGIFPRLDEDKKPDAMADKLIVDPSANPGNGIYQTLSEAIRNAKAADEILIKHTGLLRVEPIKLEKSIPLTIKPYKDKDSEARPILTLERTTDREPAMFRVHDGTLNLENLEFLLKPDQSGFTAQVAVLVVGDGECNFKNCVATLIDESRSVPLALVKLADSTGFMKMDPQPARQSAPPKLHFERCFVRGDGDFVATRASRPALVEAEDCLVALVGSFLNVEGGSKETAPPNVQVKLRSVTAYVVDHNLVRLAARDLKWPVSLQVKESTECLFAFASEMAGGKAMIHLDGPETTDAQMKQLFTWEGGLHNVYCRFDPMLDQQSRDEMPLHTLSLDRWKVFFNEPDARTLGPGKFTDLPANQQLSRALPANFKVKTEAELPRFGADIGQLPRPSLEPPPD